jgi:hypothetical protein
MVRASGTITSAWLLCLLPWILSGQGGFAKLIPYEHVLIVDIDDIEMMNDHLYLVSSGIQLQGKNSSPIRQPGLVSVRISA